MRRLLSYWSLPILLMGSYCAIQAQPLPPNTTLLSSGFSSPLRIIATPRGNVLVADARMEPNSGAISLVDRGGNRLALIQGLPSGLSGPELSPDGPTGMAYQDRVLYVAIGEGDAVRNGPRPGTMVPNPAGIASPLLCSILRIRLNTDIDLIAAGFRLERGQHDVLADGNEVRLTNGSGGEATLDVLVNFPDATPDPATIYRNTHPFSLSLHPSYPGEIFLADAGQNGVVRINTTTGRARMLTRFAPVPNPGPAPGPPVSDAVPDGLRPYGDEFLVTLLTGFPFNPFVSRVMTLNPGTGASGVFIANLSSAIDILYRATPAGPVFYVLEFSADQSRQNVPGRLSRIDAAGRQILVDGLITPTSLAWDQDVGDIFISELATGRILKTPIR